jgi:putative membrane protein insertion efficiency factor
VTRTRALGLTVLHLARRIPSLLLMALVRVYQLVVSPLFAGSCRFYPSCSAYGLEALRVHGALRGTWLTARRLLRCHPWNPGGVDEVPTKGTHPHDHEARAVAARAA